MFVLCTDLEHKIPYCCFRVFIGIIILPDHRCQIKYGPRSFKLLLNTKDCEVMFRKLRKLHMNLMKGARQDRQHLETREEHDKEILLSLSDHCI